MRPVMLPSVGLFRHQGALPRMGYRRRGHPRPSHARH